jgi:hypothetical protein
MSLVTEMPFIAGRSARRGGPRQPEQVGLPRPRLVIVREDDYQPRLPSVRAAVRAEQVTALRLTRRGRVVVRVGSGLLVLITVVSGVLLLGRPAEAGSRPHAVSASYRVVLPGETLWQIAGEISPGVDRRETVAKIIELNGLSTAAVLAGQRIAVPGSSF